MVISFWPPLGSRLAARVHRTGSFPAKMKLLGATMLTSQRYKPCLSPRSASRITVCGRAASSRLPISKTIARRLLHIRHVGGTAHQLRRRLGHHLQISNSRSSNMRLIKVSA